MSAKLRIIFFSVGVLVSVSWGVHDRSEEQGQPPLWYQLQQEEIRRESMGSRIFLWFTAFMIAGTWTLYYSLTPTKNN